jgi:hypothetical protein
MRLAPEDAFAGAAAEFAGLRDRLQGYRADMIDHPVAGWCLRNYIILTEFPELLGDAGLSEAEIYWSRYYWLTRFRLVWSAVAGFDAGLEQQFFGLLEAASGTLEFLPEIEVAAQRAAAEQLRVARIG